LSQILGPLYFSSDKYSLKFNGKLILQGIDDQTTGGIAADYNGKHVMLQCAPQEVKGNATADDVRKIVPSYSDAKVNELVELMKGSTSSVEVGRLCAVSGENACIVNAQVFFD
ncbi:hypothetical protein, partial [Massilia scottii]|uniref:hypothetical protein n=1 Tax=Massilia scottii TaxID=3057166 RepID=UPI002796C23C